MNVDLTFGRFLLSVEGEQELTDVIPAAWRRPADIRPLPHEKAVLRLTEEAAGDEAGLREGWNAFRRDEGWLVHYVRDGKTAFSLRYAIPDKEVTAAVANRRYTRAAIQFGSMLALYRNCIGFHGVTLLYRNEIIILSAPSGTGKTTLGKLLERYGGAMIMNGDFALLSPTEAGVVFEPTPFCGTSGRSLNHRVRVNRVVFLSQARENTWRALSGREAMIRFMSNAFIAEWDESIRQAAAENILKCVSSLKIHAYGFAPEPEAAAEFIRNIGIFDEQSLQRKNNREGTNMAANEWKLPTSKEEMEELSKMMYKEISLEELAEVTGGSEPPVPWICPFCGTTIMARSLKDCQKHLPKCPQNPYKG